MPKRPKVLFFDVNETLLDLEAIRNSVAEALGGRGDLLPLWFTTMLQYSLVATVGDRYRDFGEIGAAALQMVAANHKVELTEQRARAALAPLRSLPPHDEGRCGFKQLNPAGFRLFTLTNSSQAVADAQMQNAGLTDLLEGRLSIESLGMYKPHTHVYRWAARQVNTPIEDCMLVAAHGWDVAGASWAGMQAAFVARPSQQLYPLADRPAIVEPDVAAVARQLLALEH